MKTASVILWGTQIGAVAWDPSRNTASFEWDTAFQKSGLELAPFTMPNGPRIYSFPELNSDTFRGLPGMIADSLPDRFGTLLIEEWRVRTGRPKMNSVEQLCYVGRRAMGALEFEPANLEAFDQDGAVPIEIDVLVEIANRAVADRDELTGNIGSNAAAADLFRVGTSAGGARAKALIAVNDSTGEIRSGQVRAPEGFGYWILKFDGVDGNRDKELVDGQGYGCVEYAYSEMAREAGIAMSETRLLRENGRSHFMTKRFDRAAGGEKRFFQSLCALGHLDFNLPRTAGYEQAFDIAASLEVPISDRHELFRRMVFNVMARNQDDHTKNLAFEMKRDGAWCLSPAFDISFNYNPSGAFTSQHQMTIGGKADLFLIDDLVSVGKRFRLGTRPTLLDTIAQVDGALARWPEFAAKAKVDSTKLHRVYTSFRRLDSMN